MKSPRLFKITTFVFLLIELLFGILVQITHGHLNTAVSYLAVLLCFGYSLLFVNATFSSRLVAFAIFFTAVADLFLVVLTPMRQLPAMLAFSTTQLLYAARIYHEQTSKARRIAHLVTRAATTLISLALTALILKDKTDPLSLISVFYYANLLCNLLFSFFTDRPSRLFSLGLIFFALCDLCVGLNVLSAQYLPLQEGTLLYTLAHPGFNLAWVFYVPSQILLALSAQKKNCSP